jgi:hypothetical protein
LIHAAYDKIDGGEDQEEVWNDGSENNSASTEYETENTHYENTEAETDDRSGENTETGQAE